MILFGQFLEVLIGGLLSGVLYSLVALGFVLIFKASGVFNFAQGAMVLLAGLALVRSLDFLAARGVPMWAAVMLGLLFAAVIMAITAWLVERFVLGPLVNQDGLTLFMSTIGATFVLEGASQMIFGSDVYPLAAVPDRRLVPVREHFPRRHSGQQARRLGRPDRRRAGGGPGDLLPAHQDGARAARGGRRSRGGAVGRHSRSAGSGSWSGWSPGWWRWWRRPCGAPSSACSSPSPSWR